MPLNEMPQTFRDAITITRRLGLRYLWIDSLCICQDDAEDWAREAGRMADVYSDAYVVIAANRSSDCTGGCFHKRAPRAEELLHIPIMGSTEYIHATSLFPSDHSGNLGANFVTEPLTKRGWALQERTLAQRVLNYNERQMYFECNFGIEAEDGPCKTFSGSVQHFDPSKSLFKLWYDLIYQFGERELSRATDMLPAMSGWAKRLQKEIKADYVAGLWSNALLEGMAWRCEGERKPASLEEYTGPSWSWASFGGSASYSTWPKRNIAKVLGWHVQLKEEANPFGEVGDAWIQIRGPVIGIKPNTIPSGIYETEAFDWSLLYLDNQSYEESEEWRNWDLQVMLLYDMVVEGVKLLKGLVFKGAIRAGQHGKMERVGWIQYNGNKADRVLAEAKGKPITLV